MIDRKFFERPASQVAKDLQGMIIVDFVSPSDIRAGTIVEAEPYNAPHEGRGKDVFNQEAGKVDVFASRRGPIPVITAHSGDKSGLVTITEVSYGGNSIYSREIAGTFRFDEKKGLFVGDESGLYIGPSPVNYGKFGVVARVTHPTGGAPNRLNVVKLSY
ncbi:DNA-3-methyladenine glycosylase [Candidatus Woesearchaeota archaeon]|nr:DNA-3-methyladenine glycosylase [Candidatus Woesearchaeota archaeon]